MLAAIGVIGSTLAVPVGITRCYPMQSFLNILTAILFGPGTRGEPTAADWADTLGTIHYEVVTSPRGRVALVYREAGQP